MSTTLMVEKKCSYCDQRDVGGVTTKMMTETKANTRVGYCGLGLTESDYCNRKVGILPVFMSGTFHTPEQEWMKNA